MTVTIIMTLFYRDIDDSESPTDRDSEDSLEVRVKPIKKTSATMAPSTPSSAKKNKRKSLEPKRLTTSNDLAITPETDRKRVRLNSTGSEDRSPPTSYNSESRSPSPVSPDSKSSESPNAKRTSLSPMCLAPKKRFKFDALRDIEQLKSEQTASAASEDKVKAELEADKDSSETDKSPFRPWSRSSSAAPVDTKPVVTSPGPLAPGLGAIPAPYLPFLLPGLKGVPGGAPHPLQALLAGGLDPRLLSHYLPPYNLPHPPAAASSKPPPQDEPLSLVIKKEVKTEVKAPVSARPSPVKAVHAAKAPPQAAPAFNVEALIQAQIAKGRSLPRVTPGSQRARNDSGSTEISEGGEMMDADRAKQRNYKNMTRERRVEANARERQRVHTITAAFDNLQAAIPTDEKDSKLSKLSVIKIATAYIMALSRMAGHDYTEDQSAPPVEEVISHCSEVIEKECRIKKRNGSP